jgi:hypothetical protein
VKQPLISGERIWSNHERRVLRVFENALKLLIDENDLDVGENILNRKLYFCIKKANAVLLTQNEGIEFPIMYEANNQPDADDEQRVQREDKRPDFQWGLIDETERDPLRQDKFYVIECKRLGKPVNGQWVFNENYVGSGIRRFIQPEHGYGKSAPSGAMIGYIRSMTSEDILNEVNGYAEEKGISSVTLSDSGWVDEGVSRLDQELNRPQVPPSPFSLRHLWVDLRQE